MKTFTVIDWNNPEKFFTDCVGCVLETPKQDQLVVYTASGKGVSIGPQIVNPISLLLYQKVLDAALAGGTITIPDLNGLNDDELRVAIDQIQIEK